MQLHLQTPPVGNIEVTFKRAKTSEVFHCSLARIVETHNTTLLCTGFSI